MGNILSIYVNQASLKHKSYSLYSSIANELTRTLFPVESTHNVRIKMTHHRVIGDNAFGKEYHLWMLAQSVSVLSSFKCSQWYCVWKKMFYEEIISHTKRTQKRLCYY